MPYWAWRWQDSCLALYHVRGITPAPRPAEPNVFSCTRLKNEMLPVMGFRGQNMNQRRCTDMINA